MNVGRNILFQGLECMSGPVQLQEIHKQFDLCAPGELQLTKTLSELLCSRERTSDTQKNHPSALDSVC